MSELTPETLRVVFHALWHSRMLVPGPTEEDCLAHVSAWTADRGDKALAIAALAICREQRNREEDRAIAAEARIEALERRERVGDRMHDFLCRLFSNPRLLPESFAPEAWTLMQDWTAPPPEAALRSEEET